MKRALLLVAAVAAAEGLPILLLVAIVVVHGAVTAAPTVESESAFAAAAGAWVGPFGGAAATFVLSWWVGHSRPTTAVRDAAIVGIGVSALDLVIIETTATPWQWLFAISNAGKIAAALIGGRLAAKRSAVVVRSAVV